jgi:tetratricopeptide (TPR) repeat protein
VKHPPATHLDARITLRRVRIVALRAVTALLACMTALSAPSPLLAQDPKAGEAKADAEAPQRLIDQEPWDRLQLDQANGNEVFKIVPLPSRVVPVNPSPTQKLRIRLLEDPDQEYDVEWQYIASLKLYEQMVLEETIQLIDSGDSWEAWENLQFLMKNYPGLRGLEKVRQDYLYKEAGRLYQQKKYDVALGVLEELYRLNDEYASPGSTRGLNDVLAAVIDRLVADYMEKEEYVAARRMLDRIEAAFREAQKPLVDRWRQLLVKRAQEQGEKARRLLSNNQFLEARVASRRVLEIWPKLPGAQEFINEVSAKFPVIVVGVTQTSSVADPASFDHWAARRIGRLTQRMLIEFDGHRPDGGIYTFPLGDVELSVDRQHILLDIDPDSYVAKLDGFDISRRVLGLAEPASAESRPLWRWLCDTVTVEDVYRVDVALRAPHVLPQALLQVPLQAPGADQEEANGIYRLESREAEDVRFSANPRYPAADQRYDIFEHRYQDSREAALALRRGEVDVLDRVFPADVARLRAEPHLVVQPYSLPTMHLLIPSPDNEFTANATFRRALLFGIDRRTILDDVLLEGAQIEGCKVVSGPFPPGVTGSDSWAYGYDPQIEPRPYQPRLALTMVELAKRELQELAKKRGRAPPKLRPLTLAHPADDVARAVCKSIAEQLELVGLKIQRKELLPDKVREDSGDWDLLFAEVAMWEPFTDADRLLSMEPVARLRGDYVRTAQRRLNVAPNESEGRRRLRELHLTLHQDLTVLPLWQMVNHRAHLRSIQGLDEPGIYLYHDVTRWRRTPEPVVASK